MSPLAAAFLTVHTPRYCTLEAAIEGRLASEVFARYATACRAGRRGGAGEPRRDRDQLSHLITTFPTVVDGTPRHQGVLTAQEALRSSTAAYTTRGDDDLAARIIARGRRRLQCVLANDVHYPLDYGTLMPMVCYSIGRSAPRSCRCPSACPRISTRPTPGAGTWPVAAESDKRGLCGQR
jgi:hypothetical protein